jgi:tetratricopeptide (TPR) repeat protein
MLKLCHIGMLSGILLAVLAFQGPMHMGDRASAAAPSTPSSTAHEPVMPDTTPGAGTTSQQAPTTQYPDADTDGLYQAGRVAYAAGATLEGLGQRQAALDKFLQAAERFEQVVQANPNDFKAIVNWGAALARLGKPAEAVLKYQQALALVPDHANRAETLYNWGTALERLGRHQEAIEKFDQAIVLKADLLSPTLQGYLQRHRLRQQDSEINTPGLGTPTRQ